MSRKTEIETTLERSLRAQVKVPVLGRRFDAGVWARIEAEESRRAPATLRAAEVAPGTARWMQVINLVVLGGAAVFALFLGAQMLAGSDVASPTAEFSPEIIERITLTMSSTIAGAALIFGLMFTPWVRRLRDELS